MILDQIWSDFADQILGRHLKKRPENIPKTTPRNENRNERSNNHNFAKSNRSHNIKNQRISLQNAEKIQAETPSYPAQKMPQKRIVQCVKKQESTI